MYVCPISWQRCILSTNRLLVLTSERRVRPPSPTLSLRAPDVEPSVGEAAITDLFRLFSQSQHHAHAHPHPRQSYTRGLVARAATPSFLSAGIPRDRRGRIGGHDMKRMILSAGGWPVSIPPTGSGNVPADDEEDEGGNNEGNETPRVGAMEYRDQRAPTMRLEKQHANTGGWGLGAGNEEKEEEEEDDDETMNWDQAQVRFRLWLSMVT